MQITLHFDAVSVHLPTSLGDECDGYESTAIVNGSITSTNHDARRINKHGGFGLMIL